MLLWRGASGSERMRGDDAPLSRFGPWIGALGWSLFGVGGAAAIEIREIGPIEIRAPATVAGQRLVFSRQELWERLGSFVGALCEPEAIAESLARPYRFLGYVPTIEVSCGTGALSASIRESNQTIDLITFDESDLARLGIARDPAFEENRGLYPVAREAPRAVLRGLIQTREGDLYNSERYRNESQALRRLGYAIAVVPGTAAQPGAYPRAAYLVQSLTPPEGAKGTARRKTNYFGGTGSYGPRQRSSLGLLYQKDALIGVLDRLSVAPSYNASVGGDLAYVAPLLAAREAPRRLYDLEFRLFSSYQHNRLLDGVETDERRSGWASVLGIRPLNLKAPHTLRLALGIRQERTDLEETVTAAGEETVTLLQLGAEYEWRHTYRWPSLSLRLSPSVDIALEAVGGERSFVRPGLEAGLHQRFPAGVETDVHLLGGTLDRSVPAFELWSLGGANTLRGFREDSFLGRHLAALQAEMWLPLFRARPVRAASPDAPVPAPASDRPVAGPRIARFLRGALFADAGHLSGSLDGRNETATGAGVGLRFIVPRRPLVIRLDYGWGFGAPEGGPYPYISFSYHP